MKFLLHIVFVSLLSACHQDLIYSETAPSWVNDVRSGKSSLRFNNGDKILFRTNHKGNEGDKREDICSSAIEKNILYIKKAYPFYAQIPMTVELVFFDPKMNDCSTTISVSRLLTEEANTLSGLKKQHEIEIEKINKEKRNFQNNLKKANDEKKALETKVKELNKISSNNKGYFRQIKSIEKQIKDINIERKKIRDNIEKYVYTGMNSDEVIKIMKGFEGISGKWLLCGNEEDNAEEGLRYFDYILCGIKTFKMPHVEYINGKLKHKDLYFYSGFIEKICNAKIASCYKKELKY